MREKLVLIDGHSILNRAFYGLPDLTNSEGLHTNGVYGFLNILFKILEQETPNYLVVAFDVKKPTFRHEMYQAYKGTRKGMPEELKEQVPVMQEVLRAMDIPVQMQAGYEADDILGTLAKQAEKMGMDVSLVSGDRDLLQLASEHILIRIPKTKRGGTEIEDYHTKEVIEKYGLTPAQIVDLKGLMGDTADNIPGVPGVGEKTAVKVLQLFPSLEEAYEHIEEVEPKRARELLREHKDLAVLSKKLATIKTDCPVTFCPEEAKLGNLFTKEAFAWIKKLELKSLLKRFDSAITKEMTPVLIQPRWVTKKKELQKFLQEIHKTSPSCVGVAFLGDPWVTTGTLRKKQSKKSGGQLCFAFAEESVEVVEEKETEYPFLGVSVSYDSGEGKETICALAQGELDGEVLLDMYRDLETSVQEIAILDWKNALHLTTPVERYRVGKEPQKQQGFSMETSAQRQERFGSIRDLQIGAYLLNPLKDTYLVDDIARDYLDTTILSYEEYFGKVPLSELVLQEDAQTQDKLLEYFGYLSGIPLLAWDKMKHRLQQEKMLALMQEIEMPTAYYLYEMERLGVEADREMLSVMAKQLEEKMLGLETDIYDLAGEEFNINSPKQLGTILFEKMKLPFAKKTKTGYSTSADILEKLRTEDPIVDKILQYRQIAKLKSTYAEGLAVFIEEDHRIHGTFHQTITATGRISSADPNLQNIPIRMDLGRQLRKVFRPKEGYVFLDADYSQIELRVLAHMSEDAHLIEAYQTGQDIHRATAAKVFHTPYEEVTELQRRNAKAVNFGIVYGISAYGLSQDLNSSRKEAEEIIRQYFASYPAIKTFLDTLVEQGKQKGYAETIFGRKRPIPELHSGNFMQRSFGERVAMNSPIQGTAADIIKIAMIRVAKRLQEEAPESRIVLQVHDELLVETKREQVSVVRQILQEEMPKAASLLVPLEVEVEEGSNWYEAH